MGALSVAGMAKKNYFAGFPLGASVAPGASSVEVRSGHGQVLASTRAERLGRVEARTDKVPVDTLYD